MTSKAVRMLLSVSCSEKPFFCFNISALRCRFAVYICVQCHRGDKSWNVKKNNNASFSVRTLWEIPDVLVLVHYQALHEIKQSVVTPDAHWFFPEPTQHPSGRATIGLMSYSQTLAWSMEVAFCKDIFFSLKDKKPCSCWEGAICFCFVVSSCQSVYFFFEG